MRAARSPQQAVRSPNPHGTYPGFGRTLTTVDVSASATLSLRGGVEVDPARKAGFVVPSSAFAFAIKIQVSQTMRSPMRKSQAVDVVATHSGVGRGRISSITQRLSEAGILPKASGQNRPNLNHDQMARLLIAVLADNGLGSVERSATVFAGLHSKALGLSLIDFLSGYLEGATVTPGVMVRSLIVRNDLDCPGASVILLTEAGAFHATFGAEVSEAGASKHAILSGTALDAIATAFRLAQVGR